MPLNVRQVFPDVGDDYLAFAKEHPVGSNIPDPSSAERIAYHVLGAPIKAASGLSTAVKNLLGVPLEEESPELQAAAAIKPGTGGDAVSDFALGGLLPMALQMYATGGILNAGGLPALAARSPLAARVVSEAAQFGTIGLQTDRQAGAVEAAVGGTIGGLKGLPLGGRILPAALLGLASKAYYDSQHPESVVGGFTQGDIAGTLNTLFGIVGKRVPARPVVPDNFAIVATEAAPEATPVFTSPEHQTLFNAANESSLKFTSGEGVEGIKTSPSEIAPPPPIYTPPPAQELIQWPQVPRVEPPSNIPERLAGEAVLTAPQASPDSVLKTILTGEVPSSVEDAKTTMAKKLVAANAKYGGFIEPAALSALGRTAAGAFVGGTAGALADPEGKEGFALGAALGGGAALLGPSILRSIAELKSKTPLQKSGAQASGSGKRSYQEMVAKAKFAVSRGEDTFLDRGLDRFDKWFSSTRSEGLKRVLGNARGIANFQVENMEEAIRKASIGFKPDANVIKETEQFLLGDIPESQYLQSLQNETAEVQAYRNLHVEARKSMDGLMEIGSKGQPEARKKLMLDTRGEYLTSGFKLFNSQKYKPTQQSVNELADRLTKEGEWTDLSLEGKRAALWQYVHDVKQQKGLYTLGGSKESPRIDQQIFKKKKILNQEWRNFLGDITDPTERVRLTLLKLKPMAEAAEAMSQVVNGLKDDLGNPYVYANRTLLEAAQKTNPSIELQNYQYIPNDYRYGQLQGKMVHRHIADVLDDWEQASKVDSGWTRSIAGLNRLMKSNVTYRNPAAIMRQVLGAPFFMAIGKAHPKDWGETLTAIRNPRSELGRELIERGIVNSDYISRDVMREVDNVTGGLAKIANSSAGKGVMGMLDEKIVKGMGHIRNLDHKMADLFRAPDNFVRANAYVSAKYRIAKELGKQLDDPEVINKAVEFTNRYTMNYDLVAPIIKSARNIPGLSLFLTYTAEITRLMKNIGQDAISGKGPETAHALMALGTIAALPEIAQKVSESNLSEKDKADWDKVKAGLPYYSKNRYKLVTGRDKKNGSFNYIDYSSIVPIDNYAQMVKALASGNLADAAKLNPVVGWDNSPAFNIISQNVSGIDKYTHRPLRGTAERLGTVSRELLGPFDPGSGSIRRKAEQAFAINSEGERGLTDKAGRRLTPADFFATAFAGLGSGQYNLDTIQRSQVAQAKSDIANELAYLNDIVKSDAKKEVKQAAAERTKLAIVAIQQQLNETINPTH